LVAAAISCFEANDFAPKYKPSIFAICEIEFAESILNTEKLLVFFRKYKIASRFLGS